MADKKCAQEIDDLRVAEGMAESADQSLSLLQALNDAVSPAVDGWLTQKDIAEWINKQVRYKQIKNPKYTDNYCF